jgi:hypothetical protein
MEHFAELRAKPKKTELLNNIATSGYNVSEPIFDLIPHAQMSSALYGGAYSVLATNALDFKDIGMDFHCRLDGVLSLIRSGASQATLLAALEPIRDDNDQFFTDQINASVELARDVDGVPEAHTILEALLASVIPLQFRSIVQDVSNEVQGINNTTVQHIQNVANLIDIDLPEPYLAPYARDSSALRIDGVLQEKLSLSVTAGEGEVAQTAIQQGTPHIPLTYKERMAQKIGHQKTRQRHHTPQNSWLSPYLYTHSIRKCCFQICLHGTSLQLALNNSEVQSRK